MASDTESTEKGGNLCEGETASSPVRELWREVKEWRKFWDWRRLFQVLFLGLAASLFDSLTDFNFARSIETDCNTTDRRLKPFDRNFVSSPCGLIYYKAVERLTYVIIAYPGIYLGFDCLLILSREMTRRCWSRELQGITSKIGKTVLRTFEIVLVVAIGLAAWTSEHWDENLPHIATAFDFTIRAMAYLSFTSTIGVKCLGLISHGPKTRNVVFHATVTETIFEAGQQLRLFARCAISSGNISWPGILSAVSSIVLIGKVGVEDFLARHDEKVSRASTLGKLLVAASVLPVFLLTALFKIGTLGYTMMWKNTLILPTILLGIGLPILVLTFLRNLTKDFAVTDVGRGVLSEMISFHLWTKNKQGKRIKLAMTVFTFLLFVSPLPFITENPAAETPWTSESNNTESEYKQWETELAGRLWIASISSLVNGGVVFVLGICLILFEDQWVAGIVSTFPNLSKEEENDDDDDGLGTVVHQKTDKDANSNTGSNTSSMIEDDIGRDLQVISAKESKLSHG